MQAQAKSALLVGASGLVGGKLLQSLLTSREYGRVTVFVRKPLSFTHEKLEQVVVDFDHLDTYGDAIQRVEDVFCCLGTTIKIAKTKEAFHKVDYVYPVELAQLAQRQHAQKFLIITAMGADAQSRIFYNQVKGQVEKALQELSFPSLHIFRPSLLLGDRREFRFGEKVANVISSTLPFLFVGPLRKYKPIHARTVANAMLKVAQKPLSGVHVFESDEIASMQ